MAKILEIFAINVIIEEKIRRGPIMHSFLKENSVAPGFSAPAYDGKLIALSGLFANGPVVLSFLRSFS